MTKRPFAVMLCTLVAAGQQPAPQAPESMVVFKSNTNLVIVNVTVRDKSGNPVENLKKDDFTLFEDGKAQQIAVFELQRLTDIPAPEAKAAPAAPAPVKPAVAPSTPTTPPPEAAKPGTVRYRDRRLMVLFFDFTSMPVSDQIRAQKAGETFVEKQMTSSDVVSIMTFSNRLRTVQDFTGDKETLLSVIKGFRIGESASLAVEGETPSDNGEEEEGALVVDDTEFNIFNTDRKLSALESAVRSLGALPERKAMVYFSSGVGKTGTENLSQLRSTVNAAVRANVAFYPIDARGLMAVPPGGDASVAAPRGSDLFSGRTQNRQRERINDQQETLTTLAGDTGGKVFLDNNDLSLGVVQAQTDIRSYYILGYYSTNAALDGRFRRVKVDLAKQHAGLKLDYRAGYYSQKIFSKFNSTDKERQLEEALLLGDPVTALPLVLEIDYFRLNPKSYLVPVAVKIPGSELVIGKNGTTEFDLIGQVRDSKGRLVANVRDGIRVKLKEENAAQLSQRSIEYDTGFTLPPGEYKLKFLARENQTGKMGTFETAFTIPDLSAPGKNIAVSSVVWSNQRAPLSAAVGSAGVSKKMMAIHPLVHDGQKIVPSITRVFKRDQNLYVYFEVYDPAGSGQSQPSVSAALSFYRGKTKISESTPLHGAASADKRHGTIPFEFQVPLAKMPPGRYVCQVNVVDELGRRFGFVRAPLVVQP